MDFDHNPDIQYIWEWYSLLDHSDAEEFTWLRRFSKEKVGGFHYKFEVFKPWLNQVVKHSIFDNWDKVKIRGIKPKVSWRFTSYDEYKNKNLEVIEVMKKHYLTKEKEKKEKEQKERKERERKRKERERKRKEGERKRRQRKQREDENDDNHNSHNPDPSPSGGSQQPSHNGDEMLNQNQFRSLQRRFDDNDNGDEFLNSNDVSSSFDVNANQQGQILRPHTGAQRKRKRDYGENVISEPAPKRQRTDPPPPADNNDASLLGFLDQFIDAKVPSPSTSAPPNSASLSQLPQTTSPTPTSIPRIASTHPLHGELRHLNNTSLSHNLLKDAGYDKEIVEAHSIINACFAKARQEQVQDGEEDEEKVCLIPLVFL